MRWVLALLVMIVAFACTEHGSRPPGDDGGVVGDAAAACEPTANCMSGPVCGNACCGVGERCEAGICTCGGQKACTMGDICATGGPIGTDACGSVCCGQTQPCPL
jgi:hypothetical protein